MSQQPISTSLRISSPTIATEILQTFQKGILAGVCIALGCVVNLVVGGLAGSTLFSFGLMAVILWKFSLYTGALGFFDSWKSFGLLWVTLAGNICGCALVGAGICFSRPELIANAQSIMDAHMAYSLPAAFVLSAFCGFIMTVVVKCGRMQPQRQMLIVIAGVILFIQCGFIHSIADAGYIAISGIDYIEEGIVDLIPFYIVIVLGNLVGGNLHRIVTMRIKSEE